MMKRVLIDAGHGMDTPGKRSPDGSLREYLWNRQVADLVMERLQRRGIPCELVVTETNDISLKTRCDRVNAVCRREGTANVLLVSIHANAMGMGEGWYDAKGWCAFTTKGETRSDNLAECFYDAFERAFPERKMRKDLQDGDRDWEENFYILRHSLCPAVLLENFFYTNKDECAWMLREDTKARIADAIVDGLLIYYSQIDY